MAAFFLCGDLGEADLMMLEGGADFFDRGAMDADGFVEDLSGDLELVGPVTDVGG